MRMISLALVICAIALAVSFPCYSQQWTMVYGPRGEQNEALCIKQTIDGGYIVTGRTSSLGAGGYDVWVMKLNHNGSIAWQKTYEEGINGRAMSVQTTYDGGYVAAGEITSSTNENKNCLVLKVDANGEITDCDKLNETVTVVNEKTTTTRTINLHYLDPDIIFFNNDIIPEDTSSSTALHCGH